MAKFLEGGQENDFNNQQGIAKRKSFPSHFAGEGGCWKMGWFVCEYIYKMEIESQ